ncbi:MAG: hypothetical protein WA419_13655 [Silvibacterium sp.]
MNKQFSILNAALLGLNILVLGGLLFFGSRGVTGIGKPTAPYVHRPNELDRLTSSTTNQQ